MAMGTTNTSIAPRMNEPVAKRMTRMSTRRSCPTVLKPATTESRQRSACSATSSASGSALRASRAGQAVG